jgi:hypothetical protein
MHIATHGNETIEQFRLHFGLTTTQPTTQSDTAAGAPVVPDIDWGDDDDTPSAPSQSAPIEIVWDDAPAEISIEPSDEWISVQREDIAVDVVSAHVAHGMHCKLVLFRHCCILY